MKIIFFGVALLPILRSVECNPMENLEEIIVERPGGEEECTTDRLCPTKADWARIDYDRQCHEFPGFGGYPEYEVVEDECWKKMLICVRRLNASDVRSVQRSKCNKPVLGSSMQVYPDFHYDYDWSSILDVPPPSDHIWDLYRPGTSDYDQWQREGPNYPR